MNVKEKMTTEEVQKLIDSYFTSLQWIRNQDEEIKRINEEYQREYEENLRNGINSDRKYAGCSVTSQNFISLMCFQVKKYNPHTDWINMWIKKFKDDYQVLNHLKKE